MKRLIFALVLLSVAVAGCQPREPLIRPITPQATHDMPNGIRGQVFIGPMCPVVREGEECPDQPYQATLLVLDENGRQVGQAVSDASGFFLLPLPPGTYTIQPQPPAEGIAFAGEQEVVVEAGAFTAVVVTYDSGIR